MLQIKWGFPNTLDLYQSLDIHHYLTSSLANYIKAFNFPPSKGTKFNIVPDILIGMRSYKILRNTSHILEKFKLRGNEYSRVINVTDDMVMQ